MKGEERQHLTVREYVADLSARGRYHFISADAQAALGVSPAAAKLAINRLSKQKVIASPARGFYVIVPPEYHELISRKASERLVSSNQCFRRKHVRWNQLDVPDVFRRIQRRKGLKGLKGFFDSDKLPVTGTICACCLIPVLLVSSFSTTM